MSENYTNGQIQSSVDQIRDDIADMKGELSLTLTGVSTSINNLVDRFDKIVKYLLFTVCLLALGKGAIELIEFLKGAH